MSSDSENSLSLPKRLFIYQKERFPILGHGVMISAFTFSAVSYSRICRGEDGFINLTDFLIGIFATITFFFWFGFLMNSRIRKTIENSVAFTCTERTDISQRTKVNRCNSRFCSNSGDYHFSLEMLLLYTIVLAYLLLMGVEFFVPDWLKQRQILYITSHMVIIPLIDIYSSGLDWRLDGDNPHWGLLWFFAVSYTNGLVLEFGRKIRTPESEEDGVISYTGMYGTKGGTLIWISLMFTTMLLTFGASFYAGFNWPIYVILGFFFCICSLPGWLFIKQATIKKSKYIEHASAVWTILMYLSLGGIPMMKTLIF